MGFLELLWQARFKREKNKKTIKHMPKKAFPELKNLEPIQEDESD